MRLHMSENPDININRIPLFFDVGSEYNEYILIYFFEIVLTSWIHLPAMNRIVHFCLKSNRFPDNRGFEFLI